MISNSGNQVGNSTLFNKELFRAFMLAVDEGIVVIDEHENITFVNSIAETCTGWTEEEVRNTNYKRVFDNLRILDIKNDLDLFEMVKELGSVYIFPIKTTFITKDGDRIYLSGRVSPIISTNYEFCGIIISIRDVTNEYEKDYEIEAFLEVNLEMLCVADTDGIFHKVNRKFEEVLGYKTEELEGKSFLSLVHEDDLNVTLDILYDLSNKKSVSGFTNRYRCKNGSIKYIEWCAQPSKGKYVYSSARDVTTQVVAEKKLKDQVIHDELTGIFNRRHFNEVAQTEIMRSERNNSPLSLVMFDIDHFKTINDTYGHQVGDEILIEISSIVKKVIRATDSLCRVGGEEFVMLLPDTNFEGAYEAASKILHELRKNKNLIVGNYTASFGVCEHVKEECLADWYRRADDAMYTAKVKGRNQIFGSEKNIMVQLG